MSDEYEWLIQGLFIPALSRFIAKHKLKIRTIISWNDHHEHELSAMNVSVYRSEDRLMRVFKPLLPYPARLNALICYPFESFLKIFEFRIKFFNASASFLIF